MLRSGRGRWTLGRPVLRLAQEPGERRRGFILSPPALHYHSAGWYDNDAANLSPVAPLDEAQRIGPLMGVCDASFQTLPSSRQGMPGSRRHAGRVGRGAERLLRDDVPAAAEATEKIGYTCAAQLVEYLYRLDPTNKEGRKRWAEALRMKSG